MSPTHQDLSNDTTFSQIKSRVPVPLNSERYVRYGTYGTVRMERYLRYGTIRSAPERYDPRQYDTIRAKYDRYDMVIG